MENKIQFNAAIYPKVMSIIIGKPYNKTNPQNNAYRCVLSSCAENSIYEVNEMLESCGFEPLGSSKMG